MDVNDTERIFWVGELLQIFPKPGKEDAIYKRLKKELPAEAKVYRRDEIPARFNYRNNTRIPPILVLPKPGWVLSSNERYTRMEAENRLSEIGGSHGYDNEIQEMRALFIGHGKAFKKGLQVRPFKNTEVYNLMCRILSLPPAENDGTMATANKVLR